MNQTLTLIFTVRIDSRERLDNLIAAMRYYRRITAHAPMIVLETDASPQLKELMTSEFPETLYMFVTDTNPVFHRTHYINMEFARIATPNAAVIDADVIVPQKQLMEANSILLANPQEVMAIPYDGRAIDHGQWRSELFRRTADIHSLTELEGNRRLMFGYISVGGAFVVNVANYKRLGWENEHFIGWGCEDHERVHRLYILGHKPLIIPGTIHHLNHPRGINSGNAVDSVILSTKREYCRVCAMTPAELRHYISTWRE